MLFGDIDVRQAEGAILAHTLRVADRVLSKGRKLDAADVSFLLEQGLETITAATLEPGDVGEDEAACRAAVGLAGDGIELGEPYGGRVNYIARHRGLLMFDRATIDKLNLRHEALAIGTLEPFSLVEAGQIVATIKVMPFAVPGPVLETWEHAAVRIAVLPLVSKRLALIQTMLPGTKPGMLDKTVQATLRRLDALNAKLLAESRVPHETEAVAAGIRQAHQRGADIILVCGASAVVDRRDVIPSAMVEAGGTVLHYGMPVDPGNLLVLGRLGGIPVLGLPGCARSPKLNGVDLVLRRLAADMPVDARAIMGMGVGGLLVDTPLRPQPRSSAKAENGKTVAAVVLAAGKSSRMGESKPLIEVDGISFVERTVDAAIEAGAAPIVVVVGNDGEKIARRLDGRDVLIVENPDFAQGLSTSLKRGVEALPEDVAGALICLADMPDVDAALMRRLMSAFDPVERRGIVVPVHGGRRGNPVLWSRQFFADFMALSGDVGARKLLDTHDEWVTEIEVADEAPLLDLDTPEALAAWRKRHAEAMA
ncbi:MAG TPA: molybdopterin-binding/glycosyltransferase family 2 protein [Stellaceae bacterium]|nr:molybdopterin-binding/glycosyltransferase family 2 protein [Stellaceae bacterium]